MLQDSSKIFIFILIFNLVSFSQTEESGKSFDELLREAKIMYADKNYLHALHRYELLDEMEPGDTAIQYALAVCYIDVVLKVDKAIQYLENIKQQGGISSNLYYYLGKAFNLTNELDSAKKYYLLSLEDESQLTVTKPEHVKRNLEMCNNARFFLAHPHDPKKTSIQNIGNIINTEYSEYVPVASEDQNTLIFTYRGPGCTGGLQNLSGQEDEHGFYFEDVFIAYRFGEDWTVPVSISENVNTNLHDAVTSVTSDEKTMLVYKSDGTNGDIYISTLDPKKNDWTVPKKVSKNINTEYFESHATFTGDGKTIYFSSEMPGGFGGLDIYKSVKDAKGKWSIAENLGENINTPYDEDAPFIFAKGNILYFSSKGHSSMGGYDIFRSIDYDGWTKPQNMGYPINTTDDDLYFSVSPDGKKGFFGSKREDGYGLLDVYAVNLNQLNLPFFEGDVDSSLINTEDEEEEMVEEEPIDSTQEEEVIEEEPVVENQQPSINLDKMSPEEIYNLLLDKYGSDTIAGLKFKVQIGAYEKPNNVKAKLLAVAPDVKINVFEDGITRFFTGEFKKMIDADVYKKQMQKKNISDAFVVGFYNEKRLFIHEVAKLFIK